MAAAASASPAADPALLYTAGGAVVPAAGYPVVSPLTYAAHTVPVAHTTYTVPEVSVPTVGLKDTGLVVHPESGAITPEFTAAQVRTIKQTFTSCDLDFWSAIIGNECAPFALFSFVYINSLCFL